MLKRIVIVAGLAAAPLLVPAAQAQAAQSGVLIIYGEDKCPTNDDGEEIVVCQRLDEADRFRIPQNLRQQSGRPQANESWAVRSADALDAGRMGTGSCSTVGPGGQTGCFVRQATRARAESNARRDEQTDLPLP
jgi:hypothetical protein